MLLLNLPLDRIEAFLFVLVRVSSILFSLPFLDSRGIPLLVKSGLAIAASILILPMIQTAPDILQAGPVAFVIGMVSEMAVGMIVGLVVQLFFTGIQIAGEVAGFQMGVAIANVFDPATSTQVPVLSQFLSLFAMMVFLTIDAHHYFIQALVFSFDAIPLWGVHFAPSLFDLVMERTAGIFLLAVRIGAPVIAALLLSSVALGLVARTVPQLQIFAVALPMKILLGLLFLGFSLPYCVAFLKSGFTQLGQMLQAMMRLFG